jgi:hypothetical protein
MILKILASAFLLFIIAGVGYFALVDMPVQQKTVTKTISAQDLGNQNAE